MSKKHEQMILEKALKSGYEIAKNSINHKPASSPPPPPKGQQGTNHNKSVGEK